MKATLMMQRHVRGRGLLVAVMVASCGGGGSNPPTTPAPSNLQYSTPPAFVVQTTITPLTPTVSGQVTSYSVSPALPAGISLDPGTGVISASPTAVTAKATYAVTATNA